MVCRGGAWRGEACALFMARSRAAHGATYAGLYCLRKPAKGAKMSRLLRGSSSGRRGTNGKEASTEVEASSLK